jgi:hypothetical protein
LNPVEYVWRHLSRTDLAKFVGENLAAVRREARRCTPKMAPSPPMTARAKAAAATRHTRRRRRRSRAASSAVRAASPTANAASERTVADTSSFEAIDVETSVAGKVTPRRVSRAASFCLAVARRESRASLWRWVHDNM